jgi:hypothetical protein
MKRFLRSSLFWLSFLAIISCQKNEETPTATITFLNNNTYTSNTWAVVSDQSGKVLSWKSLPTDVSTTLTYHVKDSVNVTIISSYGNDYQLSTYANVAPGNYSAPPTFQYPPILGTYKVQNLSPTDYSGFQVTSECGSTESSDQSEWRVNVCANSSLFVGMQKTGFAPRYLYSPQISANGSVVIDQTKYNSLPEMKTKYLALDGSYDFGFVFLNVIKDSNPNWFYISSSYSSSNANSQPLYYPDQIGSAFDEYYIFSVFTKSDIQFASGSTVKDVSNYSIPTFNPKLDVVTSATTSNLNFDLSGSADYVETIFNSSYNSWIVDAPFSKKVSMVLPIFPDDLRKEVDFSFLSTLKLQSIAIGDTDLGGYASFYKNSILGQKKWPKNPRYKTYKPKADGSIGGGS